MLKYEERELQNQINQLSQEITRMNAPNNPFQKQPKIASKIFVENEQNNTVCEKNEVNKVEQETKIIKSEQKKPKKNKLFLVQ